MDKPLLLGCKGCGNAIVESAFAVAGVITIMTAKRSTTRPTAPRAHACCR